MTPGGSHRSVVVDYIRKYLSGKGVTDPNRQNELVSQIESIVSQPESSKKTSQVNNYEVSEISNNALTLNDSKTKVVESKLISGMSGLPQITNLEDILKQLVRKEVSNLEQKSNSKIRNMSKAKNENIYKHSNQSISNLGNGPVGKRVYPRHTIQVYNTNPAPFNEYAMSPNSAHPETPTTAPSNRYYQQEDVLSTRYESPNYLRRRVVSRKPKEPICTSCLRRSDSLQQHQTQRPKTQIIRPGAPIVKRVSLRRKATSIRRKKSNSIRLVESRTLAAPQIISKHAPIKKQICTSKLAGNHDEAKILRAIQKKHAFSSRSQLRHSKPKIMKRSLSRDPSVHREMKRSSFHVKHNQGKPERQIKIEYAPRLVKGLNRISKSRERPVERLSRMVSQKVRRSNASLRGLTGKASGYLRQSENHLISMD